MKVFIVVLMAVVAVALADKTTSEPPTYCNVICPPKPDEEPVLVPHPDDCEKYCNCDELGVAIEQKCPPGLHFNNKLKLCDWPWEAGCDPNYPPPRA